MALPYRLHHARENGVRICLDCRIPMEAAQGRKKRRVPLRCTACKGQWDLDRDVAGRRDAHKAVNDAVKAGTIRPATERACYDCGARANRYDHRDYSRALDVDPVCISCNLLRGPGAPAKGGLFSRLFAAHMQPA